MADRETEILEDVRLLFRNFAGEAGPYNNAGNRNFNILLSPEKAEELQSKGYNVRATRTREGDDGEVLGGEPIIEVKVNFGGKPPTIVMITPKARTQLTEDTVGLLDAADIEYVDVMINPYHYNVNGKTGIKAYLESIYVTVQPNYLRDKYSGVNNSGDLG